MTIETILIGGPADGRRATVYNESTKIVCPARMDKPRFVTDHATGETHTVSYRETVYHPHYINIQGTPFYIHVHQSIDVITAIQMLINSYTERASNE